jgi:Flp pilus assembly protein TadD
MRWTLLLVLASAFASAQTQSGGSGQTSSRSTTTRAPTWSTGSPVPVAGKVILDSGGAPPEAARVELRCGTNIYLVGFTDSAGGFGSSVSGTASSQDASLSEPGAANSGGLMASTIPVVTTRDANFQSCEVWATYPGYKSGPMRLPGSSTSTGRIDVGTIILHRLANVPGNTVSVSSLAAPKAAVKALQKGHEFARKQKWAEAMAQFHKATEIYPQYAVAWYEFGRVSAQQGDFVAARETLRRATSIDPKYVAPYLTLAHIASTEKKWAEAMETSEHAIQLDPVDYPEAFFFNAVANINLGHAPEAEKSLRAGIKIDGAHRFPRLHQLLGILLAQRREFTAAAESLRTYLKLAPTAPDAVSVLKQVEELDRLASAGPFPAHQ